MKVVKAKYISRGSVDIVHVESFLWISHNIEKGSPRFNFMFRASNL
jgi:hypothetical protein